MYQGIIIKSAPSDQPRDIDATSKYMLDLANEGAKVPHDEAGPLSGSLNCVSDTRQSQLHELECQLRLHGNTRSTQAVSHQVMSYPDGCRPTRQQIERDLQVLLKKYGMESHPLIWDAHGNTKNFHVHFLLSRISQTPDKNGGYPIADGGLVKKTSKEVRKGREAIIRVRTDWAACRQCAVAELNETYGWGTQRNVRYTPDGKPIQRQDPKDPHSDKTRRGERKSGRKSRERQISETAQKIFASSKSWHECDQLFGSFALEMTFKTQHGKIVGGYITGPDNRKCSFSKCGPACSYPALEKRFGTPTPNDAACVNEYYLMPFEYQDLLTPQEVKKRLLPVFKDAKDWPTLSTGIQHQGMCLERSGGGLIVRFNDNSNSLKCSEISNKFSLSKLENLLGPCPIPKAAPAPTAPTAPTARELLIQDAKAILEKHVVQRHGLYWMESDFSRANIRFTQNTFQHHDDEHKYWAIERDGVSVPLSAIAKHADGKPVYTMWLLEKLDREDSRVQKSKMFAEQQRRTAIENKRWCMGGDLYEAYQREALQQKQSKIGKITFFAAVAKFLSLKHSEKEDVHSNSSDNDQRRNSDRNTSQRQPLFTM